MPLGITPEQALQLGMGMMSFLVLVYLLWWGTKHLGPVTKQLLDVYTSSVKAQETSNQILKVLGQSLKEVSANQARTAELLLVLQGQLQIAQITERLSVMQHDAQNNHALLVAKMDQILKLNGDRRGGTGPLPNRESAK